MLKRITFIIFLVVLALILFFNPNFKTIAAGVAILLFGMIMLEEGFKVFTKGPLQNILKKATNKLYKSNSSKHSNNFNNGYYGKYISFIIY